MIAVFEAIGGLTLVLSIVTGILALLSFLFEDDITRLIAAISGEVLMSVVWFRIFIFSFITFIVCTVLIKILGG